MKIKITPVKGKDISKSKEIRIALKALMIMNGKSTNKVNV